MTNDPFRNVGRDEALRQNIVRTMIKLSDDGVANVDELRDKTLALVVTRPERPMPPRPRRRRSRKAA